MKNINNGKQMTSIWKIPVASGSERLKDIDGNKLHQTQKPEKLLYNIIISSTKKGDIILDPFLGTGTTATISKKLGRNYIGIEQDKKYIHYAEQRIKNQVVIDDDYVNAVFDKKLIRVPFIKLVEEGFIDKNEYIYFNNTEEYAVISDVKELLYKGKHYSIHSLAGILKGLERANGWNYWYVKRNNKYISIDHYRNLYREKYSK